MLSERQKLVLIAIVEEYVRTNEPVGSLALSKRPELGFSTATLRNDMASLEEMGYLEKTHTSSGRIPSQKGYKLYVQDIIMRKQNDQLEFPLIDEIFNRPNITREEAYLEIGNSLMPDEYHILSDLAGGLTNNQCKGNYYHSKPGYWEKPHRLEREAFAHFFGAVATRSDIKVSAIKEMFPTAFKEFEKLMEEIK